MRQMKKAITEFLPEPHPTKAVFSSHHIPVVAVARFLDFSTAYTCSLLNGFARVTPDNDMKLREFALLVESSAEEGEMIPAACLTQRICSPELGGGPSIARKNGERRPVSRGHRGLR
jgi:hypothetical protein